jgi:hypothetical protein
VDDRAEEALTERAPAPSAADAPFVLGGDLRRRPSRASVLSLAIIAVVIAIPLRGLYKGTGSSMEEGFMLVFPERMLAGDVPNVDFLHLYGPGSLHVLMGWYEVFGFTLPSERTFGLLQHIGIITAVYALTRAWGHRLAVVSAVTATLLVLTPIGLSALAWEGGVALALWAVVFGVRAIHTAGRDRWQALAAAGALAGMALSFRPDLVLALGLAFAFVLWRVRTWKAPLLGAVIGLTPMWIHLAVAGIGPSWRGMVTDPVFELRPGRELPRPPSFHKIDGALQAVAEGPLDAPWWRFPAPSAHHQLFLWFFVVIVTGIGVAVLSLVLHRRDRTDPRRMALLAGALLGVGMLPQALQRPDSTHLAWGSCVSFSLLPALIVEVIAVWRRRPNWLRPVVRIEAVAAVAVALALFVGFPFYTYRYYLFHSRVSIGDKPGGFEVDRDGRTFSFGNEPLQRASQAVVDDLERLSSPGQRLLVGPADLSRTIYSDVVFYHLFPELEPATYFIEMDPGIADEPGSRLASDVASADWVLLTNFWTGWYEPNASSEFGGQAPNEVVATQFCLRGDYLDALILLYGPCLDGDVPSGESPAGRGIGAFRRASLEHELATGGDG